MRRAEIFHKGVLAGVLEERDRGHFRFAYASDYRGEPVSLTMPVRPEPYEFTAFPTVFEGLLSEGPLLQAMLRSRKLDRGDLFGQLVAVGEDVVGSLTVREVA